MIPIASQELDLDGSTVAHRAHEPLGRIDLRLRHRWRLREALAVGVFCRFQVRPVTNQEQQSRGKWRTLGNENDDRNGRLRPQTRRARRPGGSDGEPRVHDAVPTRPADARARRPRQPLPARHAAAPVPLCPHLATPHPPLHRVCRCLPLSWFLCSLIAVDLERLFTVSPQQTETGRSGFPAERNNREADSVFISVGDVWIEPMNCEQCPARPGRTMEVPCREISNERV